MELPVLAGLFLQSLCRFLGCVGIHWCCADAWKSEEVDREMVVFSDQEDSLANLIGMETC